MSVPDVTGELLAAGASRGQPATLRAAGGLTLVREGRSTLLDTGGLAVSHRLSGVARRLTLPDGAVFVTADDDGLEALLAAAGVRVGGRRIAFLEAMRPRLIAVVTLLVAAILVSMRWEIPGISRRNSLNRRDSSVSAITTRTDHLSPTRARMSFTAVHCGAS